MDAPEAFDLVIIGGGINGAGIARDAAGRGFSTLLCEQNDLGWATSSASTKLIHGGLRYLEYLEFRLVAESLAEREVMLKIAPHIVRPMTFVLPHEPHLRSAWMIRAGLFLYDTLGGRSSLPRSRPVRLDASGYGAGLKPAFARGFTYSDLWVDDARLVVLNARSAADKGATILTRTRCVGASRSADRWRVRLRDDRSGVTQDVGARVLVNAAGPWVRRVLDREVGVATRTRVRLVRGSHIVVPRVHDREHAIIVQNPDRRVLFMIPYEGAFTEIGTTEVPMDDPDERPRASPEEIEYLCAAVNRYVAHPIGPASVRATWSGVRPLFDDGSGDVSSVTRDYRLELDEAGPPLLSVFGGKLTTYRKLAERALERLERHLPPSRPWTASEPLPGGDFGDTTFADVLAAYRGRYPGLDPQFLQRLLHRHGTSAAAILGDAKRESDLGRHFGAGLYQRELAYLVEREWAASAEDVLERRTKCGLLMNDAQRAAVASALEDLCA